MAIPTVQQVDSGSPVNELLMLTGLRNNLGTSIGMIVPFFDFNGDLSIPSGFMWCNGDQITEAAYDAIHGSGKWDEDVVSTSIENKYTPNLNTANGVYLVGSNATQAGTSAITTIGNSSHQTDSSHSHEHNHQWLDYDANYSGVYDRNATYNSSGSKIDIPIATTSAWDTGDVLITGIEVAASSGTKNSTVINDSYTNNDSTSGGSSTLDIQPESVAVKYIIKVV